MVTLESYSVKGLRSLADVRDIPVRTPTVITGANDGGKSTALKALDFLLGGPRPTAEDHTMVGATDTGADSLRHERIEVVGFFSLDQYDTEQLGLPSSVQVRRVAEADGEVRYEIQTDAPTDSRFRSLSDLKIHDLVDLATETGVEPSGARNTRAAWLEPLAKHAASLPHEQAWVAAPKVLVDRLPRLMLFSSTNEPNPENQIRVALKAAFKELLDDPELVGPVRSVESTAQHRLAERATELCTHVAARCPELESIAVVPEVTFTEGFRNVEIFASRSGGAEIPLNRSGAGRRRRINLAIWEWTGNLIEVRGPEDRAVVIAYDEPDTHLDYAHQRDLVELIQQQCAKEGVRMAVATHSLNLIDRVDMENVVHLRIEDELTVMDRLMATDHESIDQHLLRVSEAMGLRNSVILHERSFLGVEGPTEMQTVPTLFRLSTGMSLQSAGIALIAGNGNDGALNVVKFLREHGRTLSFLVVDADSTDRKLFRKDKLHGAGIREDHIHFVGTRELEDLFSNEQWAATANQHWPRTDGSEWTADHFRSLRQSTKFSKAIENAVRSKSAEAPERKTGYLVALVQDLTDVSEVPADLVAVFRELAGLGPLNGEATESP
ncbi:MAG TPA: TOPRIM nucleotidyl transferase/hydrolase domain-containing protein [Solirubrobacterales bacterium]|nr:TOPRIM nucleotidyl transferase/hydrolase domain-containing protein [Solirubrobacterales bacterium]